MEEQAPPPPPVAHFELKATLLLVLLVLLVGGAAVYLLYARGFFEARQRLVLIAEDSEGVTVGMDLGFSGFPIGRVQRIELGADGNARILIDVPRRDAHWLRETSVFTLERNLVGGTRLRAFSGVLGDPPLPDGAERKVLIGDATAEIPRVLGASRELLQNLVAMTAAESALGASLGNLQAATDRLRGPQGALGMLFGNEADAKRLLDALDRSNALLARIDTLAARADTQVFGPDGLMPQARAAVVQLDATLGDARETLKKVDAVLVETQAVAANARVATTDLGALRAEVDANLRKVEQMLGELRRKWPFARDTELKLP